MNKPAIPFEAIEFMETPTDLFVTAKDLWKKTQPQVPSPTIHPLSILGNQLVGAEKL